VASLISCKTTNKIKECETVELQVVFNEIFSGMQPRQYVKCSPWRWGRSYIPKRRKTFTSWSGGLPEESLLKSVAVEASTL